MRISSTEWPSGQVPDSRHPPGGGRTSGEPPAGRAPSEAGAASSTRGPHADRSEQLRRRVVELQRSAARLQEAVVGLEGLRRFFSGGGADPAARSEQAREAERYLAGLREPLQELIAPHAAGLRSAVLRGEEQALADVIAELSTSLRSVASELGRFETARQNSRSLSGPADPLAALVRGVRGAGEQLLQPDGKSALDLLG